MYSKSHALVRWSNSQLVLTALLFALMPANLIASSPVMGDRESYRKAAQQPKMQDRLRELELFASSTETTDLKIQALVLMAWYYKQLGAEAEANRWARQLLTLDRENPLGLAVLVENARRANPATVSTETFDFAQRGVRRAERFAKPEGMPDSEFTQLRQRMLGILHGTIGYFHFQQKDYANARGNLRKAVTFLPGDAHYVYALALANLQGADGNASEGYWYLARAVNLTQGTPAGKQIADYAANRYEQEGGSASNWEKFLVAASAPPPSTSEPAVVATAQPKQAQEATPAPRNSATATAQGATAAQTAPQTSSPAAAPPASASRTTVRQGSNSQTTRRSGSKEIASATTPATSTQPSTVASNPPTASVGATSTRGDSLPQADATSTPRATMPAPVRQPPAAGLPSQPARTAPREVAAITAPPPVVVPRAPLSPRDPISLGILIETGIATEENRSAVIYALVDMVRHLRNADEAFILSFGQELQFKQDLTQNYDLLEEAISAIEPDGGEALLDAVGFASGHLGRIAKHRNRVLLVISNGQDFGSRTPGYEVTHQIDQSGVRIYCIGVGALDSGGRARLEQLASRTGGRTSFVANPLHFRAAARQLAAGLGIEFPM